MLSTPLKKIMSKKTITIPPNKPVKEIIKLMDKHNIMGIPVVNKGKHVLGMVTESDIAEHELSPHAPRAIGILGGIIYLEDTDTFNKQLKKICAQKAKDIMTTPCFTLEEENTIQDAINGMKKYMVNRVPITKKEKLVGIVTRNDVLHALAEEV